MTRIDGGSHPVELAPGYRLTAPGLQGEATAHVGAPTGTRRPGVEESTDALDIAFEASGFNEIRLIEVDVARAQGGGGGRGGPDDDGGEVVLEVPDLGDTVGQAVMAIDDGGGITWHLPEPSDGNAAGQRSGAGGLTFKIPLDTGLAGTGDDGDRSLIGTLGTTLLKVVVYPVTDAVLGPVVEGFARRWEEKRRPNRLRWYGPGDRGEGADLTDADLGTLASGRSLWFVHGTFSTASSAFPALPDDALGRLHQEYQGRVVAFEHHTLSEDPTGNLRWLQDRLKGAPTLDIDIVSHSRGGLVARVLSGELEPVPGLEVGQAVMVGTPNHGTVLADPDHVVDFLDRISTILNVFPPGPASVVAEVLEAVLAVVKIVGSAGLSGLPGLGSMNPSGEYLAGLATDRRGATRYRALAANFEPSGPLVRTIGIRTKDATLDRVFEDKANDLIVPTLGVYQGPDGSVFPMEDVLEFSPGDGVQHSGFFSHHKTVAKLEEWLQG